MMQQPATVNSTLSWPAPPSMTLSDFYELFKKIQGEGQTKDAKTQTLNVACVFSPPAEGNQDVLQIQEDLPQEKADNQKEPEKKKAALKAIIADYNKGYGVNFDIYNFDGYYRDIQARIKDQQYPNKDLAHAEKIDIVIVVDMLLTGFDSKYLNTLYVAKNLKHHSLIQAFSRTNRVLNDTKPFGKILDFRQQEKEVNDAITLFSGEAGERAKDIWLVESAPKVIAKFDTAVKDLGKFMQAQGLPCRPEESANLKGNEARAGFITCFKEIRRLKTQLDQYSDLSDEDSARIEKLIPNEDLRAFQGAYLEIANKLKEGRTDEAPNSPEQQLDFEFVLFASAVIDYDYIMKLVSEYSKSKPEKQKMSKEQLLALIESDSKFIEERADIIAYINSLPIAKALNEEEARQGYERFKTEKFSKEIAATAKKHGLESKALAAFVDKIVDRMRFDEQELSALMEPLGLDWSERSDRELALMQDLTPMLHKRAEGRDISGLSYYEK